MNGEVQVVLTSMGVISMGLIVNGLILTPNREAKALIESILALSRSVELRFPNHQGQTDRVIEIAAELADSIPLSATKKAILERAACLRDIGLAEVPYQLVNSKPSAEWTQSERDIYFYHAEAGANMLAKVKSLRSVANIVRWHHSSYAMAEANPDIPVESSILHIATDYAFHEQSYGNVIAQRRLSDGAGTEYDPELVSVLLGEISSNGANKRSPYSA